MELMAADPFTNKGLSFFAIRPTPVPVGEEISKHNPDVTI
jgi:hypothetical protein